MSRKLGEGAGEKEEASEKNQNKHLDPAEEGEPGGFRKVSDSEQGKCP